ncbi:hypothetical protein [Photobacterium leiognathi]|nr:hypothetical protein [Photobacterium leiognathi]
MSQKVASENVANISHNTKWGISELAMEASSCDHQAILSYLNYQAIISFI